MAIKMTEKGILVEGNIVTIMSDLTNITRAVKEAFMCGDMPEEKAERLINMAVGLGLKSEEELKREAKEVVTKILKKVLDGLEKDTEEAETVQRELEENETE